MAAATIELQKAVYALLIADAVLQALLPKIVSLPDAPIALVDKVPADIPNLFQQGNGPTYATLGSGSEIYRLAGASDEEERVEETVHDLVFHVFSQQIGLLECKAIAFAIRFALVDGFKAETLRLPSHRITTLDPMRVDHDRMEDGFTSHAGLKITVVTNPTA